MPIIVGLGIVGNLATVCSAEFTKFTPFYETGSATPVTVNFVIVSGSTLKLASSNRVLLAHHRDKIPKWCSRNLINSPLGTSAWGQKMSKEIRDVG